MSGGTSLGSLQPAWDRLPEPVRAAFATAIVATAGLRPGPAATQVRHRRFDDREIERLRAKLASEIVASPTAPNRVLSGRLGLAASTYKHLGLHHFARQVLQRMAAEPRSAIAGYGGASAAEGTGGPDS